VWAALARQWALVEEANKRLSQKSAEVGELRVAHAAVREEAAQAWEAEAKAREDAARAREEAAKAHEDITPLLARVKELEEDVALVGYQRDALNIQIGMASTCVKTLEDEVVKRAMAVVQSRFEYDMDLIADGFITDPDRTDEENEVACLNLIEAAEEPGSRLAKLFEVEVVPPTDDEGL
jgi:hypothetical protein